MPTKPATKGQKKPTAQPLGKTEKVVQKFDHLPRAAHVAIPVAAALTGISRATYYRLLRVNKVPAPKQVGGRSVINVGELRDWLGVE
jgi:predicted DNA-binding transcriptional regulator AlpA